MHNFLFLHGFGDSAPENSLIYTSVRSALPPETIIYAPCYHPNGNVKLTQIKSSLNNFIDIIKNSNTKKVNLIGYSFGGLLAAFLEEIVPEQIENVLLLAPAIDNIKRNYQDCDPSVWPMPVHFVNELKSFSARPKIIRPTTLIHGTLDDDAGGSAPWRIEEWAKEQPFKRVHILEGVDHALEPWLTSTTKNAYNIGTFAEVIKSIFMG
jgi:pimeloyl-ACP methyl ester carboxylesterase